MLVSPQVWSKQKWERRLGDKELDPICSLGKDGFDSIAVGYVF